ncbi:unnamed protein product [Bursaphelenchus okinawaensis]|uniref:WD_REPEATS_REGION domain-containing protein n=1 Tax=Bursaphelenchus okinawaensis TaxID=465554 RepID=A0A811JWP6_9BILA|nr:unnamed protein product [Bursaphelenchus okinawaensis]CAG9086024.1 unnamed protein product [Bursaphelenchus okinawaensis]
MKGKSLEKRGRKKGSGKAVPSEQAPYKYSNYIVEDHMSSVYGCMFNPFFDAKDGYYLATCGANHIHLYFLEANGKKPELRLHFQDDNKDESLYALTWAVDEFREKIVLIVGGASGVMRVIDPMTEQTLGTLRGHGDSVNEIRTSCENTMIVASASKDRTARIWNVGLQHCLAIYGGSEGHLDEVISCDFHIDQTYLLTASMDHTMKVWDCRPETKVGQRIKDSYDESKRDEIVKLASIENHFPLASTKDVHTNYVDCARFIGKFVISKSCEGQMVVWKFGPFNSGPAGEGTILRTETYSAHHAWFDIPDTSLWFIKFDISSDNKYVAVGNEQGKIKLLDLHQVNPDCDDMTYVLGGPDMKTCNRQLAFSPDNRILMAACEGGLVVRYDRV